MNDPPGQVFAEDLRVGEAFEGTERVIDASSFQAFAELTGDDHPIHHDPDYAAKAGFIKPVAHGLLLSAITALGAAPVSKHLEDAMIAFVEQECRFLKPVYVGDRLKPVFRVASVDVKPGRGMALVSFEVKLINAENEAVLRGKQAYLLKTRAGPKIGGDDAI